MTTLLLVLARVPRWLLWAALAALLVFAALLAVDDARVRAMLAVSQSQASGLKVQLASEREASASSLAATEARFRQAEAVHAARIEEIQHDGVVREARLRADAARAAESARGLRAQLAGLSAQRRNQAAGHPGVAIDSAAAGADSGMLADMLGQCVERVRVLAAEADATRAAGQQCERAYDAVKGE